MTTRRSFLKIGAAGALLLAAGGAAYRLTHPPAAPTAFVLDGEAGAVLAAIVPAMLGPVLPADAAARRAALDGATARTLAAIHGLPLATQKEVQDLFGLLALAPARRWLAGVSGGWREAAPQEVAAFLENWRHHRLGMLQTAYLALHDLILGSWYAEPSTWAGIGYPGPLKELQK
ncbi:twin-arginine translocation signal domain-containing protein [Duganella sp. BJB488]|uniref:twin-arginine translocation signal domain-containing protein n=1 Tax=unclassified Duganella TaxID=2636909 RepID=UPI000E3442DD|nr:MULTISPECIES: twin-arginine translocation signal domain-containing protein [unclassified Duganella]RFP15132.1 twin-arginine translocation signal domain-containing protein [Duganella sp. BJB489]RFP19686.1 twin-arginine translocation signal domain-containing protein [Duganella sp. BJB488]RFP38076.1 twin-arginine translocation signal domain-containing protein [Duganella sp. BJB480]